LERGFALVIDIGKTLSKITLWSREGDLLDRQVRPNAVCAVDGLRRLDAAGIGDWLLEAIGKYRDQPIEAIIPVSHGAGAAALVDGKLAFAPLDYEQAIPPEIMVEYRQLRDAFAVTGSPVLPGGLNLGVQLFWLDRLHPQAMERATLLPWAQYWAWFLAGEARCEVSSLGCHTDLWAPGVGGFSPLAQRMGWARRFAPLARAGEVVGKLRPELAERTGLSARVLVHAGLHDSNAALNAARGFPEIAHNEATVLSTGTWFIGMRLPAVPVETAELPEARDCLVNVDVFGQPVPSARFMGGREIESVIGLDTRRIDITPDQPALLAAVPQVLADGAMLLPTIASGCGPFPHGKGRWFNEPDDWFAKRAATSLYAALVADAALDLIGSEERLLVEGRFAEAQVFVQALAALRPETAVYVANAHNDVSFGALRLLDPALAPLGELVRVTPLDADLATYRERWHAAQGVPA
jgi:sugar (pentulose or hexulose) kinase